MYTFVKLHCNHYNLDYPWMLECDSLEVLEEHTKRYARPAEVHGFHDFMMAEVENRHLRTSYGAGLSQLTVIRGQSPLIVAQNLSTEIFAGKMKYMTRYGKIYLREIGSYMTPLDSLEVVQEMKRPKMIYPSYSEEDISVKRWEGGTHYYASLGAMQVSDDEGNVKWNTHEEAEKWARACLEKLK